MAENSPPRFSLKGFGRLFRIKKNELRKTKSSNSLVPPKHKKSFFQSVNEEAALPPMKRRTMDPSRSFYNPAVLENIPNRERVVDPKRRTLREERGKSKIYQVHELELIFQQFEKQIEKVPIPTELFQTEMLQTSSTPPSDGIIRGKLSTTPPNILRVLSTTPPNDLRSQLSTTPPSDSLSTTPSDCQILSSSPTDIQVLENRKTKIAKLVSLSPQNRKPILTSTVEKKEKVSWDNIKYQMSNKLSPNQQLFAASFTGDVDTVKSLLQSGTVDVNYRNTNHQSATALHGATAHNRLEVMELLILAGADVNIIDAGYRTALHIAIAHNFVEAALLLLGKGAKTMMRDHYGYSPMHWAVKLHHFEIANDLLLFGANVNFKRLTGLTCLHECMYSGDKIALNYLLSLSGNSGNDKLHLHPKDEAGDTPFLKAVIADRVECIKIFLEKTKSEGVCFSTRNGMGRNVFHIAAKYKAINTLRFILESKKCTDVEKLINEPDSSIYKSYPLHHGVKSKSLEVVNILLSLGAKMNVQDEQGDTPLHLALRDEDLEMVHLLCRNGARMDIKNKKGKTVKKLAKEQNIKLNALLATSF